MNDSGSTFNQTIAHEMVVQFRDGVVASTDDLVVKLSSDDTEFTTQVRQTLAWPSGCMSIGTVSFQVPSGTMVDGENLVDVYKRSGTRATTSAIALSAIGAQAIVVRLTNVTDYSGNADGSGTFECKLADYIEAGEPATTILDRGAVSHRGRTRAVAKDTTGGAAHAGGMYCIFDWTAVQVAGSLAFTRFHATLHMGDVANSDPDMRRFDVDILVGGSVIAGANAGWDQFTDILMPYYAKIPLSRSDGRPFCTDATKYSPFRNVLPFADWSSRTLRRLPPVAALKFNGGSAMWDVPDIGEAQTIATSGTHQGKITLAGFHVWRHNNNGNDRPGANWVRFEGTVLPTNIVADRAYCLGAELSGGRFYVYPTRADAIADTNKVIPDTGTITGGTGVVVYPARAPNSMYLGYSGWGTGGERTELGLVSSLGRAALIEPNRGTMDALRCAGLHQGIINFHYRGTTTFKVPDIQTDSATYDGLGTGAGSTFSQDARFGGPFGMVAPTDRTSANWYEDTYLGVGIDSNHPPCGEYFYAWLHEPETVYEDLAMSRMVGAMTWGLELDRSPSWTGTAVRNGIIGSENYNTRALAWLLRDVLFSVIWPETVISGNNGESAMRAAIFAAQDTMQDELITWANDNTPNAVEMGIPPIHMNATWSNWQFGAYFVPTAGLFNSYTHGRLQDLLEFMAPYAKAMGGNVGTANGTMDPTRGGTYYANCRSYISGIDGYQKFDVPDAQWNCFGDGAPGSGLAAITVDASANTISFELAYNLPNDVARLANGALFTFLDASGAAAEDSLAPFGVPKYIRDLSIIGNVVTFKIEDSPGSGVINLTNATMTGIYGAVHHTTALAYGFYNQWISNLYPTQNFGPTYILSWCLGGMDTELEAVNDALKNWTGVGTEPALGVDSKYAYDFDICKEAA